MGNMSVANTKPEEYHFSSMLATHLWYLVYCGACSVLDHPKTFAIS